MKRKCHRTIFLRHNKRATRQEDLLHSMVSNEWKELLLATKKKINHLNGQREVSEWNLDKVKYKELGSTDSRKRKLVQSSCEKKKPYLKAL